MTDNDDHKFENVDIGDGITTPVCVKCGCHAYHKKAKGKCFPPKWRTKQGESHERD